MVLSAMSLGPSIERTLAHEYCESVQKMRNQHGDGYAIEDIDVTLRALYETDRKMFNAYESEIHKCHPSLYEQIPFIKERTIEA